MFIHVRERTASVHAQIHYLMQLGNTVSFRKAEKDKQM